MRGLERAFVAANKWLVITLLAAMAGIVFANVALRYTTNFSIVWAEEVARYLMIWMTFLGAGLVLRFGGHVAITNLHDAIGPAGSRGLRAVILVVLFAFFAFMVWVGYGYAERMRFQVTPATRIPFSAIYAAIPVGFIMLIVHLALIARRFVRDGTFESSQSAGDLTTSGG